MATESAEDPEISVTLSPSLEEWLEERAATLGVDPDELLVQLAGAYRTAADMDDDALAELSGANVESEDEETAEEISALDTRVSELETELEDSVEDLRNRVLQLRDAVQDSAPEGHSHHEFSKFEARTESLSSELDAVTEDVEALFERVTETEIQLEEANEKLTEVARAVVALRKASGSGASTKETLTEIRRKANRNGVSDARCVACGTPVTIGLLTEPVCPSCDSPFDGLDVPDAGLTRTFGFRKPSLTPKAETETETETKTKTKTSPEFDDG